MGVHSQDAVKNIEPLGWDLPKPVGWQILVEKYQPPEKVGNIILPDQFTEDVQYLTNVGKVVAKGPACYNNKERYGNDWCEVGDYVVWGRHQGTHVKYKGKEYQLLPDDAIYMIVEKPEDISVEANLTTYS